MGRTMEDSPQQSNFFDTANRVQLANSILGTNHRGTPQRYSQSPYLLHTTQRANNIGLIAAGNTQVSQSYPAYPNIPQEPYSTVPIIETLPSQAMSNPQSFQPTQQRNLNGQRTQAPNMATVNQQNPNPSSNPNPVTPNHFYVEESPMAFSTDDTFPHMLLDSFNPTEDVPRLQEIEAVSPQTTTDLMQYRANPLTASSSTSTSATNKKSTAEQSPKKYKNGALALTENVKHHSSHKSSKKHTKNRPAFVTKLWTMVNDPANQELINWSDDGLSFIVDNRELFVQQVLPKYFKHSNFASFVRQLNMYGWHKVQDVNSGSLHSDERWQFNNENFQRGKPELLDQIVRNKPQDDADEAESAQQQANGFKGINVKLLMNELSTLKTNQLKITKELSRVRQDNELLWQELFTTREKNAVQNEKIEKILQFLASVYGNRVQVLEDDSDDHLRDSQVQMYSSPSYMYQQPVAQQQSDPYSEASRFQKPRLLIKQRSSSNSSSSRADSARSSVPVSGRPTISELPESPENLNSEQLQQLIDETNSSTVPKTDSLQTLQGANNPNLDSLSKTIEQQGQSIDDIITKLQTQQYNASSVGQDSTPAGNFDLDEFLNQDIDPDDNATLQLNPIADKPGTIHELPEEDVDVQQSPEPAKKKTRSA